MIDDDYVLHGPEPSEPFPSVPFSVFCFNKMKIQGNAKCMTESISGRSCNFSEFFQMAVNVGEGLRRGFEVGKGDFVSFFCSSSIESHTAAIACLYIGAVFAPLDPTMKAFEMRHMLEIIEPKVVFCDQEALDELQKAVSTVGKDYKIITIQENEMDLPVFADIVIETSMDDFEPDSSGDVDDVIVVVPTSGSTGLPKCVSLTSTNFYATMVTGRMFASKMEGCPLLYISHLFWISGVLLLLLASCEAIERVVVEGIDVEPVMKAIHEYKPSFGVASPSIVNGMLHHPDFEKYDFSSMTSIATGGSPLSAATVDLVKSKLGEHVKISQSYGLSEVTGFYTFGDSTLSVASVGVMAPFTKLKIIDVESGVNLPPDTEGELCAKCLGLMKGYLKNPEATAEAIDEDGWLHTGDLGYYDENGAVYITGRIKELIKFENHQIAPGEIEQLIGSVPGVADVGVAGVEVDAESRCPMALVVKVEDSDVSEVEIIKCVNENLSEFKRLRGGVCFVDFIPRTPTGKIKRRQLQELANSLYLGDSSLIL